MILMIFVCWHSMLDGCDYALAIMIVILNFCPTVSAPRTAADSSNWAQKSSVDKWRGLHLIEWRLRVEFGWERTDGVTLGVIRSRHPSVDRERNRHTSPSALEDSSLILLCQLSHSAGYCFIQTSDVISQTTHWIKKVQFHIKWWKNREKKVAEILI